MKRFGMILAGLTVAAFALSACGTATPTASASSNNPVVNTVEVTKLVQQTVVVTAAPPAGQTQLLVYMQMGGNQGDPSTLARTNGAKAAAAALGIKLIEQYSGWDPQKMIDQFKEAIAAKPDGIVIMGHPGEDAMGPLVDQAESLGIIVTSGNNPLPDIETKYQSAGFGYAGADLHAGGYLTGQAMVKAGLKPGDEALVYDIWHQQGRSVSAQGVYDALTDAEIKVDDPMIRGQTSAGSWSRQRHRFHDPTNPSCRYQT